MLHHRFRRPDLEEKAEARLGKVLRKANLAAQEFAKDYAKRMGFPPIQETPYVEVDPAVSRAIAELFAATSDQSDDPAVQEAYAALVDQVNAQFSILPIEIVPYGDDDAIPYDDSAAMMADIQEHDRLFVYDGGEDHSMLSRQQNWKFRAVHDYFGHAARGFTFGPRGEENAWIEHCKIFEPIGRAALTTETRAENSWVNFGPYSDLPPADRPYAEQKALLLPPEFRIHPAFAKAYAEWPTFL